MKKLIALLTLFALVLTFAACGKGTDITNTTDGTAKGTEGGSAVNGADNSEGVPMATLEGREALTLTADIIVDNGTMSQTYSFLNAGEYKLYYMESNAGFEQYFAENADGIKSYVRVGSQSEFSAVEYEDGSAENVSPLALFGFDAEKYFGEVTGNKVGEEKVGEYDCDIYDIEYTEASVKRASRVWADKESGIWVKVTFAEEGAEYSFTVKSITDESDMPGTVPVKVNEGELYSNSGLTLNLKGIEFDPTYAAVLKMEAVNATDSALKVKSKYFDINGLCIGGTVFSVSVPAGESLAFDVEIPDKSCAVAGIDMIEEMEFAISAEKYHVQTSGEGNYDVSDGMLIERSDAIKITAECPYTPEKEESGERRVLCSTADFDVYFGGIKENSTGGYDFVVYYESEFAEDIRVTANIYEVNGNVYDDYEKIYVYAGRKGFGGFSLWSDKVTEKPTSLKLSFEAYYGEMYNGTCILEETEPFVLTVG